LLLNSISPAVSRYWALSLLGSLLDLSELRDVISHNDHLIPDRPVPIGGPLEASVSNGFRDSQRRMWPMVDMTLNDL